MDASNRPDAIIRAEIDLASIRHNIALAARLSRGVPVMAVVKADAYGHGVETILPLLEKAEVDAFAVANVAEGVRLRELGVRRRILVFGGPLRDQLRDYADHDLEITIAGPHSLRSVLDAGVRLRAHLKIDTGMHRLGMSTTEAAAAVAAVRESDTMELAAVWTHLATADEEDLSFARQQVRDFDNVIRDINGSLPTHIANSGALARMSETVEGRTFVRPGGLLYGMASSRTLEELLPLQPAMRLVSRVVHMLPVKQGESVSYGRSWVAERDTTIATIAAGYADGVPRQLSSTGRVGINGKQYPIAGRVCMDMLMVDIGPQGSGVSVGDEAVLFGDGGPSLTEQAEAARTMAYTLPTGLTARVPRIGQGDG